MASSHGVDIANAEAMTSEDSEKLPSNHGSTMSRLHEKAFFFTICMAQLWLQAGLGQAIGPLHIIGGDLGATALGELSWYAAAYSLTVGTFILPAGRIGDMYGHKSVLIGGLVWYSLWSLVAGFSTHSSQPSVLFSVCRGLQGCGIALVVPNMMAIAGRQFPAGPRKNLLFSLYGATAPTGFTIGALFASLFAQLASWQWAYWTSAIASTGFIALVIIVIPCDEPNGAMRRQRFDFLGSLTGVTALILINFAINQGAVIGWSIPYVYVTFVIGVIFVPIFMYCEVRFTKNPLVPINELGPIASFALGCIATGWGSFGIFVFYLWQYLEVIRGSSPLLATAQQSPVVVTGLLAALFTGWLLSRVKPAYIMIVAMLAFIVGNVLLATAPANQIYWGQTFFAILIIPIGLDMSFPAGTIILSNSVSKEHQGIAASLVSTVVNWSISMGLGLAATIQANVETNQGGSTLKGYRAAWYFGIALQVLGLMLALYFLYWSERKGRK